MLGVGVPILGRPDGQSRQVNNVCARRGSGPGYRRWPGGLLERWFLEALDALWADAVHGRGRLVLVPGQGGIGETASGRVVVRARGSSIGSGWKPRQSDTRYRWRALAGHASRP
jgi:hypothetical protein